MARKRDEKFDSLPTKLLFKLAIVGGGKNCRNFLEFFQKLSFTSFHIEIAGICDTNSKAEGVMLAKEMGLYTTEDYRELLKIKGLDGVVDMTGERSLLTEIICSVPDKLAIFERGSAFLLKTLLELKQKEIDDEQKFMFEKMSWNLLFQQSNASVAVLNTDYTIFDANDSFLKLVKKSKKEVVGSFCYKITRGLDSLCSQEYLHIKCPMSETLRTGETTFLLQEIPISKDTTGYFNTVTYPLKDQHGRITRVIELWRNVTEEVFSKWKKRIRDLEANMQMTIQEDRMISLGKLVASCVHEINNPIQGMLTFSHLMQNMLADGLTVKDREKFKKFLSLMSNELERCGNIVSGLLSFSRESAIEYRDVSLKEVVESVIMLTRHKMELQKIELVMKISKEILIVRGDPNQLQQCFLNLIFNAIEAMAEGGLLTVVVKPVKSEKKVKVEIRDTGYGISPQNMEHIFDPFFTTKAEGEGTGLGLSIIYGVVKKHGGKIKVNSRPGKGSSFILYFPMQ